MISPTAALELQKTYKKIKKLKKRLYELEDAMLDSDYLEASGGCNCDRCEKLRAYLKKYEKNIKKRITSRKKEK